MNRFLVALVLIVGVVCITAPTFWSENVVTVTPLVQGGAVEAIASGIAAAKDFVPPDHRISAVIVPHHLTASTSIAAGIAMLTKQKPRTIVLLSPDHFDQCPTLLCTMDGRLRVPGGEVWTDERGVARVAASPLATVSPDLFVKEHGISVILPFIAHSLSGTTVVPVVMPTMKAWRHQSGAILDLLRDVVTDDSVLVVSSDFSHYLPLAQADAKDEETAKTLFAGDINGIAHLENPQQSDCPVCLWALASLAGERGFYNPSILYHTNSARLLNDPRAKETTSHFSMVWYDNDALSDTDPAFAGDVTVARATVSPTLAAGMVRFWTGAGLRMVNLEGPLSRACTPDKNPLVFCNSVDVWAGLTGIATHWGTANNHMFDRGQDGYAETLEKIAAAHEVPVSTPVLSGTTRVYVATMVMNPVPGAPDAYVRTSIDALRKDLDDMADGNMDVVMLHFGTEYSALPTEVERALMRSLVDAGADVVIGMHTHVISDMEIYKGRPIFHGVGNFIFDQYDTVPTSMAKAVRLRKTDSAIQFESFLERIK